MPVNGNDPDVWRKDSCGAWINRADFGKRTYYGWQVNERNLIPLHWENNEASKETGRSICVVTCSSLEEAQPPYRLGHCFLG